MNPTLRHDLEAVAEGRPIEYCDGPAAVRAFVGRCLAEKLQQAERPLDLLLEQIDLDGSWRGTVAGRAIVFHRNTAAFYGAACALAGHIVHVGQLSDATSPKNAATTIRDGIKAEAEWLRAVCPELAELFAEHFAVLRGVVIFRRTVRTASVRAIVL